MPPTAKNRIVSIHMMYLVLFFIFLANERIPTSKVLLVSFNGHLVLACLSPVATVLVSYPHNTLLSKGHAKRNITKRGRMSMLVLRFLLPCAVAFLVGWSGGVGWKKAEKPKICDGSCRFKAWKDGRICVIM
jgi:hypothetical protein